MTLRKKEISRRARILCGAGFIAFLLVLWQLIAMGIGKSYLLPGPVQVVESIAQNWQELWSIHMGATLAVMGTGCAVSIILGIFFAVLMDLHKGIERALYPLLTFTQTVPVLCLAPVLVLWFGYSMLMRVIVTVLVTFFPITINVFDGFRSVPASRTELLCTYGAGKWKQLWLLRFPTALPGFFTGLQVALPWAAVGAVISEWLGAPRGVGVFSKNAMMSLDAAGLLAPLVLLSAVVLVLNAILHLLKRKFAGYRTGE